MATDAPVFGIPWANIQRAQQGDRAALHGSPICGGVEATVLGILGKWPTAPIWIGTERMDTDTPTRYVLHSIGEYMVSLGFPQHMGDAIRCAAANVEWMYEDDLPEMDPAAHAEWHASSSLIHGVRMGPKP